MKDVSDEDLLDALDHASDTVSIENYDLTKPALIPLKEVRQYDDFSSWVELEEGSLRFGGDSDLDVFRGPGWAERAEQWRRPEQIPPIVIVDYPPYMGVADGRGRVNYAIGMGWKKIRAVFLTPSG
jgi:hypothetical protein